MLIMLLTKSYKYAESFKKMFISQNFQWEPDMNSNLNQELLQTLTVKFWSCFPPFKGMLNHYFYTM